MNSIDRNNTGAGSAVSERFFSLDTPSMLAHCAYRDWPAGVADLPRHQHNALQITFCVWGEGSVELNGYTHQFSAGSIMIIPKGVPHMLHLKCSIPSRLYYLMIDQDRLLETASTQLSGTVIPFLRGCFGHEWKNGGCIRLPVEQYDRYIEMIDGLSSMNDADPAQAAFIDAALCFMTTGLAQAVSVPDEEMSQPQRQLRKLQKAVQLVKKEYHRTLTIAELARSCDISESYFRSMFVETFECTPQEYLNRYRITRAMDMIRTTDKAMLDIALSCGFSSVSAFNRNFKRYAGYSPTEWKQQHT